MTSIHIYDPASAGPGLPNLPPLPMGALAVGLVNLLQEAADLPEPQLITVSDTQNISMQFAADPASLRTLTRWALRFGGVVTSQPHPGTTGPETWCRVEFGYYGVEVNAYAHIPAPPAGGLPETPGLGDGHPPARPARTIPYLAKSKGASACPTLPAPYPNAQ